MRRLLAAACLAAGALWGGTAAADLVANPGFEDDGDLSGGPVQPTGWNGSGNAGADNALPHSGANDAFLNDGSQSQSVATVAGSPYSVDFWLALTLGADGDGFVVDFGGTQLTIGFVDINAPSTYQEFQFNAIASGAATLLSFTGSSTDGTWYLDDVSVTPLRGSDVPEPAPLALLLAGGAAAWYRRRAILK